MSSRVATTQWSQVLAAGNSTDTRGREALESLCQTYWEPLFAYTRRQGHSPDDAADLTQAFFSNLLEKDALAAADPARGRFRSFLLAAPGDVPVELEAQRVVPGSQSRVLETAGLALELVEDGVEGAVLKTEGPTGR